MKNQATVTDIFIHIQSRSRAQTTAEVWWRGSSQKERRWRWPPAQGSPAGVDVEGSSAGGCRWRSGWEVDGGWDWEGENEKVGPSGWRNFTKISAPCPWNRVEKFLVLKTVLTVPVNTGFGGGARRNGFNILYRF